MPRECFTAYIFVNNQKINSFTTYYYGKSKKLAMDWVAKNHIVNAQILVEETTDKYML